MRPVFAQDVRNEVRAELERALELSTVDVDAVVARLGRRIVDLAEAELDERPYEHVETYELELLLEGLEELLAGDEPDESSSEVMVCCALEAELDRRGALTDGGGVRPTGWPHKARLILEPGALEVLARAGAGGKLDTEAEVLLLASVVHALEEELERVRVGLEEGFTREVEQARREDLWRRRRDRRRARSGEAPT